MTTDLVLANPETGEVVTLDSPTEDLGRYLDALRNLEFQLRVNKKIIAGEINSRFDRAASWTFRQNGVVIRGQSPAPSEEWDGAELREALLQLVDEGLIAVEAVDAAVETVITYKPRKAGIVALKKLGGRVAETVDSLRRTVERERRVSVSVGQ